MISQEEVKRDQQSEVQVSVIFLVNSILQCQTLSEGLASEERPGEQAALGNCHLKGRNLDE